MKHKHEDSSPRILIGFGEALTAPEVAWSLLEAGFCVSVFARRGSRPSIRKCKMVELIEIVAPELNAQIAITNLESLLDTERFSAVMPLDDASVWVCDQANRSKCFTVIGPTGKHAQFALDKRLQIEAAIRLGFRVPSTHFLYTVEDVLSLKEFPLILKPALAIELRLGKILKGKFCVCANAEELYKCVESWNKTNPLLAQALLSGTGEGMFGFATKDGIRGWSAHRRIRMMNPKGSGSSACTSIPVDESLRDDAERMIADVGWRGMFMIEMLRDTSGKPWFIEFNGRPWGSMALARRMGFEYPAWACHQVFDATFVPPEVSPHPPIVCRHLGREILHMLIVMRGPKSKSLTNWPSKWRTIKDILHVGHADHWYNWRSGDTRLFLYDTCRTVINTIFSRSRSI